MAEQLRLMAVHAHPDDESSKGAATLARYVDEGVDVLVVSCTGGERGDVLNPKLQHDPEVERDLPELRRKEMAAAAAALGVRHHWLGFVDSGLPEGDPLPPLPEGCFAAQPLEVASAPLVRLVREFRPHVMTTYNELGGYPHPDHIMTHKVSVEAFEAAGDPTRYTDSGDPWAPLKLYYDVGFSRARMMAFHEALLAAGKESPMTEWLERRNNADAPPERTITTRVNIVGWMDRRDAALRAHATQIDPDGWFFAIPNEIQADVWPTDDFELARSLVDTEVPEDDLFSGIRDRAKV
ncbi:mycothiol conjugate amidase Mca [Kineosporia sp. J2-2]|uniref:Mycothiol S-conjugate amidase n=1 Tax=Kineosporia corallincola TaxID=2835133 RepID=A0ABS5THC2_9ACTN|nr:mycothiol conjugate amidase Mca [Kineosporia corallincola]MBT0770491.1 mycothiol conjugate amidase Mca [Kineosporia corallincola]